MNSFLIDTHVLLWLIFSPERLPKEVLAQIADPKNTVSVSSVSFWEISLKYRLGKLQLSGILPYELPALAAQMKVDITHATASDFAGFYQLPLMPEHKDPFDRMIIWQCICQNRILVSSDRKIECYTPLGLKLVS